MFDIRLNIGKRSPAEDINPPLKKITWNNVENQQFRSALNWEQLLPLWKITAGSVTWSPNIEVWVKETFLQWGHTLTYWGFQSTDAT